MPQDKERGILNCGASGAVVFDAPCPVGWDQMQPTGQPRRRFCAQCERNVHLCHDTQEAALRADQRECVAVPMWLVRGVRQGDPGADDLWRGRPTLLSPGKRLIAAARRQREQPEES
jgi:hypothetical protein